MPPKHGHHQGQHNTGTSYGGGGGGMMGDFSEVEKFAHQHSGGSGDSGMFGEAFSMIQGKAGSMSGDDVDEGSMVNNHQSFFGGGGTGGAATSGGMGQAAAMQALKMFNSQGGSSGGSSQSEFMGMAMGQASKLFDQQSSNGNVSSGSSKQGAIQEAGEMAMKMYMKSEMGGSGGGLMSMASKFM